MQRARSQRALQDYFEGHSTERDADCPKPQIFSHKEAQGTHYFFQQISFSKQFVLLVPFGG